MQRRTGLLATAAALLMGMAPMAHAQEPLTLRFSW